MTDREIVTFDGRPVETLTFEGRQLELSDQDVDALVTLVVDALPMRWMPRYLYMIDRGLVYQLPGFCFRPTLFAQRLVDGPFKKRLAMKLLGRDVAS